MRLFLLSFLIIFNSNAEELCTPVPEDVIAVLTTLSVPNCRRDTAVSTSVRVARINQQRLTTDRSATPTRSPICDGCRSDFQSRVSGAVDISVEKKRAFFDTTYKELEKSLSSIVVDVVALRNNYSTNSSFTKSVAACNTRAIEQELTRCNSPFLNAFKQKNLTGRIGNEVASLISSSQTGITGILERAEDTRSCNISDEQVQLLKPRLFEEQLTPAMVQAISRLNPTNTNNLFSDLQTVLSENFSDFIKHPILKELMKDPAKFIETFRSLRNESSPVNLKNSFRAAIYNNSMGEMIDSSNASKCEKTIRGFASAMCSPQLKSGNVSLGPFSNYDRFRDNSDISDSDLTINEAQLKDNLVMFEFCPAPANGTLSLQQVLNQMNDWMVSDDKDLALSTYSVEKYNRDFGDVKSAICGYLPATTCPDSDGTQCALYKLYRRSIDPSTPEGRLAGSPDSGMNRVLRSLIGDPAGVTPEARPILVQAGIIPQENGQLVERPAPPERQPDYLTNVANGTITPSTGGSQTTSATTNRRPPNRPQGQAQLAQPGPQAAAQPETQLAGADTSDEERRFQEGLDERLRRVEGQQDSSTTQQPPQQARRAASRVDSSTRNPIRQPASDSILPGPTPVQADIVNPDRTTPTPQVSDATLAPDSSRQTRAQRQANEARAQMAGARSNPSATTEGGPTTPTSADGSTTAESVALTISGDIPANLEQVLRGSDSRGSGLRSLIEARRPFRFQLNNSLFDVRITNGVYSVAYRSGDDSQRALASTLQTLFNNSIRNTDRTPARNTTLEALQNTVRN